MATESELFLTIKHGSIDNALFKWVASSEDFSDAEDAFLVKYSKTKFPNLKLISSERRPQG